MMNRTIKLFALICVAGITACGGGNSGDAADGSAGGETAAVESLYPEEVDPMENPGVGPIAELTLSGEVDQAMAEEGKAVYELKCTACHKTDKKYIGPAPAGIFERRNPAWVMNMILNPEKMVAEDPIAKKLLKEFNGSPMANQGLTEAEARAIVEYFRTL